MRVMLALILAMIPVSSVAANKPFTPELPKLLVLSRADVPAGKNAEHDAALRRMAQSANSAADFHWIGARPLTGDTSEFVGLDFADNYAAIEKNLMSLEQVGVAGMDGSSAIALSGKQMIARLRDDLCYQPEQVDISQARYWQVNIFSFKPGTLSDFGELEKEAVLLHRKGNINERWAAYEVEYGTATPTLIFLSPLRSLADLDQDLEKEHEMVFTPEIRRHFQNTYRETVLSSETILIAVRPEVSHPAEAIVTGNPEFWAVKYPAVEQAPAPVPPKARRKAPLQPAAMKAQPMH